MMKKLLAIRRSTFYCSSTSKEKLFFLFFDLFDLFDLFFLFFF
uniref:Uncharacterized protein n=1 Tax=Chlorella vulgaris TaxID=3077 RepID=V9H174_CHLVU|nr:hypothetical protein ChvulCp061 [Chlorella vulgaris]pir/T07248/ hypothetical protein 42a - Chlorella vulgaris chloroplast [Chlorella vulgaris]QSV10862.1 hypothetical protein [Chlorella vulgaris]BAA57895.1 unnamed protein product [Chlorella vulgaris]